MEAGVRQELERIQPRLAQHRERLRRVVREIEAIARANRLQPIGEETPDRAAERDILV